MESSSTHLIVRAQDSFINLNARIHGAILRAMTNLHRVSTPKIVACNFAAVEFRPILLQHFAQQISSCIRHLQYFVQYCGVNFSVQPMKSQIRI